jgi:catechol 2,3-dioxygenase-like lactoylglutathione lyase family enzyme
MDMRLEVVVLPVSDVDRAKKFYQGLGWRLDGDFPFNENFRVVQLTPPGSATSIIFGKGITAAKPGSVDGLHLVVDNIDSARSELAGLGAKVSEVFHDAIAPFHHAGTAERVSGPAPNHQSYGSWLSFADPDGNSWFVQEITNRLPGRSTSALAVYGSVAGLAAALRRAEAAHGKYEQKLGHRDENWPDWYAQHMVEETTRQDKAA